MISLDPSSFVFRFRLCRELEIIIPREVGELIQNISVHAHASNFFLIRFDT